MGTTHHTEFDNYAIYSYLRRKLRLWENSYFHPVIPVRQLVKNVTHLSFL